MYLVGCLVVQGALDVLNRELPFDLCHQSTWELLLGILGSVASGAIFRLGSISDCPGAHVRHPEAEILENARVDVPGDVPSTQTICNKWQCQVALPIQLNM